MCVKLVIYKNCIFLQQSGTEMTSTWFNMAMPGQNKHAWFSATHHRYTILSRGSPAIMVEGLPNRPKLPDKNLCIFFFGNIQQILTDTLHKNFVKLWLWSARINAHITSVTLKKKFPCTDLCKPNNCITKLGTCHISLGHIRQSGIRSNAVQFVSYKTVLVCFLLGNSLMSKFRWKVITQKKTYNTQNMAKVWYQEDSSCVFSSG